MARIVVNLLPYWHQKERELGRRLTIRADASEDVGSVVWSIDGKTKKIENDNPYGNASSIYTTSGHVAQLAMSRVSAGMCGVNIGVPVPREPFGFGGWNDSKFGHGNLTGYDGYRFWTRPRKVTAKWALQEDWTWMS